MLAFHSNSYKFAEVSALFLHITCVSCVCVCVCFDNKQNNHVIVVLVCEQPRVWAARTRPPAIRPRPPAAPPRVTLAAALGCALECGSGKKLPLALPGSASRINGPTDRSYRSSTALERTRDGRSVTGMRRGLWHRVSNSRDQPLRGKTGAIYARAPAKTPFSRWTLVFRLFSVCPLLLR